MMAYFLRNIHIYVTFFSCNRNSLLFCCFNSFLMSQVRVFWYTLDTLASSSDVCEHGYVTIINGNNVNQRRHFSSKFFLLIRQLLWDILPTKVKCTHLCHPSKVNYYIIQPLVRAVFGKELRLRQRVHYGTVEKVLDELRMYSLPAELIPQEMGGSLTLNFEDGIRERARIEGSAYFSDMPMQDVVTSTTHDTSMPANFPSIDKGSSVGTGTIKGPGKKKKAKKPKTNNRKGRSGRKSDPRMLRAVEIKLVEPNISLQDALVRGGFTFQPGKNSKGGITDKDLVDNDGITLSQRKNNLCRRLRVENKKKANDESMEEEEEENGRKESSAASAGSDEDLEKAQMTPAVASSEPSMLTMPSESSKRPLQMMPDSTLSASAVVRKKQHRERRRDSFEDFDFDDFDFDGLMEEADRL